MGMVFERSGRRLELDIVGYEFPVIEEGFNDYDANWLVIQVTFRDGGNKEAFKNGCMLSFELERTIKGIEDILSGVETGIFETYYEPYLALAVTAVGDVYAVQARYSYEPLDGKAVYVTQEMDREELLCLCDEMKALYNKFPFRTTRKR